MEFLQYTHICRNTQATIFPLDFDHVYSKAAQKANSASNCTHELFFYFLIFKSSVLNAAMFGLYVLGALIHVYCVL